MSTNNTSCLKEYKRKGTSTDRGSRCLLPPPPDERKVVLQAESARTTQYYAQDEVTPAKHQSEIQKTVQQILVDMQIEKKPEMQLISKLNTTIIGDHVIAAFNDSDSKWTVQSTGNATFQSVIKQLAVGLIDVSKKYVFIVLGNNQVRTANRNAIISLIDTLVTDIRKENQDTKIFFAGVLPRPVDNKELKVALVNINRWIALAVARVVRSQPRVHYLAVQHKFLENGTPITHMFDQDGFMLSPAGAALLRRSLLEMAGFRKNV